MPAAGNAALGATWLERLRALGLELPVPPAPLGSYASAARAGELLFLSGMLPVVNGKLAFTGRVGAGLSVEQGQAAAVVAVLNALAIAHHFLGGAQRIERVVRLGVAIAAAPDFTQHARVADAASNLLATVFDGAAGHARLAYGVLNLPLGAPVVLELILSLRD